LSEFVKGDRVRVLPCQHIFHVEEIDEWLIHRKKLVSCFRDALLFC
jgi:E3 ubiquitin-protein ligase RNF13/E3 ubiquitin-protein ligase RNF167